MASWPPRPLLAAGLLLSTLHALLCATAPCFSEAGGSEASWPDHVPSEILVQFRAGTDPALRVEALAGAGTLTREEIWTAAMQASGQEAVHRLTVGTPLPLALGWLRTHPAVAVAEPNWIYRHCDISNDPYYLNGRLWGMYGNATTPANANGSQAGEAWSAGNTGSKSVLVGVIDEGVMHRHADLAANIWVSPYDPVDGLDNDGNGFVDDIRGWDFANGNRSTYDGVQDDHGTHVAGTIGAAGGNGRGVAGVCWSVKLITAKFLGPSGGTTADAIRAVDYITDLKSRHGLNIVATNNSWGGGGYSRLLKDAIERAGAQEILFVAAAGNGGSDGVGDNNDVKPFYPASYSCASIIAVAAIGSNGGRARFSNYGASSVDLGAPGVGTWSTVPSLAGKGAYAIASGTSMAAPHVTGAVALYAASHPGAAAAEIKAAILASAIPTASLSGRCVSRGRLNAGGF